MGLARDAAGTLIVIPLAFAIARSTQLEESAVVAIAIQWLVGALYAIPKHDETLFDLTGAVTHASVSMLAFLRTEHKTWRKALLTAMVWLWCTRLGTFLFLRIRRAGEDTRFVKIRHNALRFFSVWNIQGLWVLLTLLPALLGLRHSTADDTLHPLDVVGALLWAVGYGIEVTADSQKTRFREDPRNKGKFIQSGLWRYSRHPNYFGEILMWLSVFLIVVPGLPTPFLRAMAALGPTFVTLLLTRISGIPLLEKQGDERWGSVPAYQAYKARTNVLIPWAPRASAA